MAGKILDRCNLTLGGKRFCHEDEEFEIYHEHYFDSVPILSRKIPKPSKSLFAGTRTHGVAPMICVISKIKN